MSKKRDVEFYILLAERILYQLANRGFIKMQGDTVDEVTESTRKARELVTEMLLNGESQ